MRYNQCILLFIIFLNHSIFAQECTDRWMQFLDTDPSHKKVVTGDSTAGYGIFSFWGDPELRLELRGKFPKVRFMSLETQGTKLSLSEDNLFDFRIKPDAGSQNPSIEGVALDTPKRSFTVSVEQNKNPASTNTLNLPEGRLGQSIMVRLYSPQGGVVLTPQDLPRIFAFNKYSGKPVACPRPAGYPVRWHFPQIMADVVGILKPLEFQDPGETNLAGLNKAARYLYALSSLESDEIILARFKAPTFINSQNGTGNFHLNADVRYWSFCTVNFPNNETLNCVPDYQAPISEDGFAHIVVGGDARVERLAKKLGYSYLPDTREIRQRTMGFVYRNLVPSNTFTEEKQFQGDYFPQAAKMRLEDFLSQYE